MPTINPGAVTLKQVALRAGVSITAVSKVLHGGGSSVRVSVATAEHIRKVAAELQYVPNALARGLRTRRSEAIGLVFENLGHLADGPLFNALMLECIGSEVFGRLHRLTIMSKVDLSNISVLGDGRLDGLIWCKLSDNEALLNQIERLKVPCVAMCARPPASPHGISFFSCDNQGGVELAVQRLYELGHRRIAFVLEQGESKTPDAQARLAGYMAAHQKLGLEIQVGDVVVWSYDVNEFPVWWSGKPPHTALIAWNEGVAGNILRQAQKAGVSVPGDISVLGFDSTKYCDTTTPPLAAIRQPIQEMSEAAIHCLFEMLAKPDIQPADRVFPCDLDERESMGPAPSSRS